MPSDLISLKSGKEIESIELNLLINANPLSKSKIVGLGDSIDEDEVDELITKFELRSALYQNPIYSISNNRISSNFTWREIPEYFLCLYYSYFGAEDKTGGTGLFERISAQALRNFISGEVIALGFPASVGFNENLDMIARACNEERGKPANSAYKDDGVDVVAYKSFLDNRSSNLYILQQCAAGIHWTQKKTIPIARWLQYIFWAQDNITLSMATSEFVENKDWQKKTTTYGILLDRLRIYNFLYREAVDSALRGETLEWCRRKIAEGL